MQHIEELGDGNFRIWYDDPEKEDPSFGEKGNTIYWSQENSEAWKAKGINGKDAWLAAMAEHLAALHAEASKGLPSGTVYEIRAKIPTDFGLSLGVAWYHTREMQKLPTFQMERYPGTENRLGGYFLMGRLKTL